VSRPGAGEQTATENESINRPGAVDTYDTFNTAGQTEDVANPPALIRDSLFSFKKRLNKIDSASSFPGRQDSDSADLESEAGTLDTLDTLDTLENGEEDAEIYLSEYNKLVLGRFRSQRMKKAASSSANKESAVAPVEPTWTFTNTLLGALGPSSYAPIPQPAAQVSVKMHSESRKQRVEIGDVEEIEYFKDEDL
jgi:hypothetical protein